MLTIGDKFPSFDLKAVMSTDAKTAFRQVSDTVSYTHLTLPTNREV